jgi:hypothetical protein
MNSQIIAILKNVVEWCDDPEIKRVYIIGLKNLIEEYIWKFKKARGPLDKYVFDERVFDVLRNYVEDNIDEFPTKTNGQGLVSSVPIHYNLTRVAYQSGIPKSLVKYSEISEFIKYHKDLLLECPSEAYLRLKFNECLTKNDVNLIINQILEGIRKGESEIIDYLTLLEISKSHPVKLENLGDPIKKLVYYAIIKDVNKIREFVSGKLLVGEFDIKGGLFDKIDEIYGVKNILSVANFKDGQKLVARWFTREKYGYIFESDSKVIAVGMRKSIVYNKLISDDVGNIKLKIPFHDLLQLIQKYLMYDFDVARCMSIYKKSMGEEDQVSFGFDGFGHRLQATVCNGMVISMKTKIIGIPGKDIMGSMERFVQAV